MKNVLFFTRTFYYSDIFNKVLIGHLVKMDKQKEKVNKKHHALIKLNILIWH
jgi:hypothetical protein